MRLCPRRLWARRQPRRRRGKATVALLLEPALPGRALLQ